MSSFSRDISIPVKDNSRVDRIPMRVVSTFGANDHLEHLIKSYESGLRQTFSFCTVGNDEKLFNFVYRTAPKLGSLFSSTKELVLGNGPGPTIPCGSVQCDSCPIVTNKATISCRGKEVKSKSGSCISRNVIYLATCILCNKAYVGKTTTTLRTRINGHRALHYNAINPNCVAPETSHNNDLSLGYHLSTEHNCKKRTDFNKNIRFTIIQHCSPGNLDVTEHKWIHKLETLEPGGINSVNPFGIPLIQ